VVPSFNINNAMFPGELLVLSDGPPYNLHDDGDDVCLVRVLLLKDVRKGEIEVKDLKDRDHLILSANWAAYQRGQQDHWNEIMTRIKNVQGRAATPAATGTAAAPTSTAPAAPTSTAPAAPTATAPATPTSTAPAAAATTAPAPTPATSEPAPAKDSGSLMPSPTTAPINPVPTPVVPAPSPTDSAPVTVTPSATPAASKGDAK
jgi:type IV secretory pathway VirJ component